MIILALILFILIILVLQKAKKGLEEYSEKWITGYLKKERNLDVVWDDLEWDILFSGLKFSGLKVKWDSGAKGYTDNPALRIYCSRLDVYFNLFSLIKAKLIEIKSINIKDLKLNLKVLRYSDIGELKGLILKNHSAQDNTQGDWSFSLKQIVIDGGDLSLDILEKQNHFMIKGFNALASGFNGKGYYPFQISFKEGLIDWRGLHRSLGSGKIKGGVDNRGVYVDSSKVDIPQEGNVSWSGNITKESGKYYINGNYSGELFCDTISFFLKPFKQMRGKISAKGEVSGPYRGIRVKGTGESEDFSWRSYDFKNVKGNFLYHSNVLDFKDFECTWRNGHLRLESQVFLKDKRSLIKINADLLPTLSIFKGWKALFPGLEPPLWKGDVSWKITWPERKVLQELEVSMNASLSLLDKSHAVFRKDKEIKDFKAYPAQIPAVFEEASSKAKIKTIFRSKGDLLIFERLDITLGRNLIKASGKYKKGENVIDMAYTGDITDRGIISRLWGIPLLGRGRIKGGMKGLLSEPEFNGEIDAEDVSFKDYHLDHVFMGYDYQKGIFEAEGVRGMSVMGAQLTGSGRIRVPSPKDGADLEFLWSAKGLPFSEILAHIPYEFALPYEGNISGAGDLRIKDGQVTAKGRITKGNLAILGQKGIEIRADHFAASKEEIVFEGVTLIQEGSAIDGNFTYGREKGWDVYGKGSSWELFPIILPSGRKIPVRGILDFNVSGGSGGISGEFAVRGLSYFYKDYNRLRSFDISGRGDFKKGRLKTMLDYPWGKGYLEMMADDKIPFRISSSFANFSVSDPNLGLMDPNINYSVIVDGNLELEGFLRDLGGLKGRFIGTGINIEGPFGKLENSETFEIRLLNKGISVDSLKMRGDKGNLEISGLWDSKNGFDMNAKGSVPMDIFQKEIPGIKALSGLTQVDLNLKGTRSQPQFQGEIRVSKGGFSVPQYNFRLDNIQGRISLTKEYAHIEKLSADARGGGWIEVSGRIKYRNMEFESFSLRTDFEKIYLYKRDVYRSFLEGSLEWTGQKDSSQLSGTVLLGETRYTGYKNIIQLLLEKKREVEAKDINLKMDNREGWGSVIDNIILNIELDLGEDFWIKSPFYNASLTGSLLIKGGLGAPWIYGDIEVGEGDVFIGSQVFSLVSGRIKLINPETGEPTINALALKDINSLRLRLSIFGSLRNPKLQFSSVPYMSQQQILNMVFFGLSAQEGDGYQQESDLLSLMLSTTSKVLDDVLGEKISYYTGLDILKPEYLPGDFFKVDILDFKLGEEDGGVERLTLGKTISRRLRIKYSRLSGEEEKEIAEAEYAVTDYFTLIGSQDDQGTYSIDLNFGFRF